MKNEKLRKYTIRFGVAFFIALVFLTYFSSTIDNMLLPQVKVTQIHTGSIDGEQSRENMFLVPLSAVVDMGDTGTVFVANTDENNKTTVKEHTVNISDSDDLYYEVTSDSMYSGISVVYSTSKSISSGDSVYIMED